MAGERIYRDPAAVAMEMLNPGGEPDPFWGPNGPPPTQIQTVPSGEPGASMVPQPDFSSYLLGQNEQGTPDFQDVAPEPIDPFNMARYHRQPKAVPKLPLWALIATGLLDAVNLRQQIKPGRNRMQYQSPSGRTKTVYTPRQAPASSNALATLLSGHATQKRAATAEADRYNEALDLMGLRGSMQDVIAQREAGRKPIKPLSTYAATSPAAAEAGAFMELYPGQVGLEKARERLERPPAAKVSAASQPSSDYRTAALLVQNEGHDPEDADFPKLVEEKIQWLADIRKQTTGDSNANKAAALKNELDAMDRDIKKYTDRAEALKSRMNSQVAGMTPQRRAQMQQDIDDALHQADLLNTDRASKNQELYNLPTKSKTTGSPRVESPTSDPLNPEAAAARPTVGGVEAGSSSTAGVAPPAQTPGRNLTEDQLTPDVIRKIRSNPDWKARAHQMFPHRPEFQ